METTPEKSSPEAADLSDNGLGLMLIVLFVLALVAALAI